MSVTYSLMSKLLWSYEKTNERSNLFEAKLYCSDFSADCVNWKWKVQEIILHHGTKKSNVQIHNTHQHVI